MEGEWEAGDGIVTSAAHGHYCPLTHVSAIPGFPLMPQAENV